MVSSGFAHVGGKGRSSEEPMVCIGSRSDPGCGDASYGDFATTPSNDDESASTLEESSVGDVDGAKYAFTACVIGEGDAGHAIEAV